MPSQTTVQRGWVSIAATTCYIVFSATAAYTIRVLPTLMGFGDKFQAIVDRRAFPEQRGITIHDRYTGIAGLDYGLRYLVTAFLPGSAGFTKETYVLQAYFLISFFPMISIYSIEAGRRGSKRSLIWYTSIWALFYQTLVGAIIIPLYHIAFLRDSSKPDYYSASNRQLPIPYAKALLPSLILGYLIPTIALYAPIPNDDSSQTIRQILTAYWQVTPLVVNLFLVTLPPFLRSASDKLGTKSSLNADLPYVEFTYGIALVVCCLSNIALTYCRLPISGPITSLDKVFIPNFGAVSKSATASETLLFIFQFDYLIIFASSLIWAGVAIYDLKVLGRIEDVSSLKLGLGVVLGCISFGPAAVVAGVWWFRESRIRQEEAKRD